MKLSLEKTIELAVNETENNNKKNVLGSGKTHFIYNALFKSTRKYFITIIELKNNCDTHNMIPNIYEKEKLKEIQVKCNISIFL